MMINIAKSPSKAVNYMKQEKDFFVIQDESDKYNFYDKIVQSLQAYNEEGQPIYDIQKSMNVNLDVNKLFDQLISMVGKTIKFGTNHHNDKKFDEMIELSKTYKIILQADKKILFKFVNK